MKLVVQAFLSLDGVVQGPGGPDEDRSGGFRHGGWAAPYFNEAVVAPIFASMPAIDALLLGRRTYEIFAAHWPHQGAEDPVAERFNAIPKYVATHDPAPLAWAGSERLQADLPAHVARLKQQPGQELHVHGSGTLVQGLLREGLVDELRLWWFPVVLGAGKRLFGADSQPSAFVLEERQLFDNGVAYLRYRKDGVLDYGYMGAEPPSAEELQRQQKVAAGDG
jgi:dihydrofolate reductase